MTDQAAELEQIDRDGALREAADAVAQHTRLDFLRKAALGLGATVGGGVLLPALSGGETALAATKVGRPPAKFGRGNVGILNYALTLEYLESTFYATALSSGVLKDPLLLAFVRTVKSDEDQHVAFLKKELARKAIKKPRFDFSSALSSQSKFAETAMTLENTGVAAYFGQVPNLEGIALVKAAASIMTVEARHAGAIGLYMALVSHAAEAGQMTPNGAFDVPRTAPQVLKAVEGTHFIAARAG